jgi:hypothetical protein
MGKPSPVNIKVIIEKLEKLELELKRTKERIEEIKFEKSEPMIDYHISSVKEVEVPH